jgi:predicted nuclease of restriction endonuclease-like (RecB) superfamily
MTAVGGDMQIELAVYGQLLDDIKARIRNARVSAALAFNQALIVLCWEIGSEILRREHEQGWGAKVIDRLAADLRREFPEMTGLSRRKLRYMRAFAAAWPETKLHADAIVQRPVAQLPSGQNISLLAKLDDPDARLWYTHKAIEYGWSRPVLKAQIATRLRERQGNAISSFGLG